MPTAPFRLKCLGFPELRGPDGKLVRIRVKKHLALLCFLAVERRRYHDRDRLVSLLWPTVSARKGRHSIATAISVLRTIFGRGAFPTNRSAIRFTPVSLELDLDRLEAGRVLGVKAEGESDREGEPDLDVDGFLRGFEIDDAPEFALWKEREHARRLPAIHAALLTLIDHGRRRGSHDEIMQQAERLLALDHLAEEGIRAKMEALALVGDRFSAIRVFDDWKERLAEELGAEPSSLVEGMAGQLRKRGWEPAEPNPVPPVPAEQWRDRRFVGRKVEYRRLYETWEAVRQYRPQHFMVAGDSGVGKTTLAQRLVTAAGLEGASVSRVQCYEMEQRIPFGMIGGLVAGLLGRPGVSATAPEALAEVGRIVPQVREHFRNLPAPRPSEGESARLLFAEGVMDLLRAVMEERPLLLVVDDLQHADEASMAVLHLVMRRIVEGRFMVALTSRLASELPRQAQRLVDSASALVVGRLNLEPLLPAESEELIEIVLTGHDNQPRPPHRRALVLASGGNPMVLELLARDWISNGEACLTLAFRAMTTEFAPPVTRCQDRFTSLIERLYSELTHPARQVLSLAALLGQHLNELSLYAALGLAANQTLEGMAELIARRVLRDLGTSVEFINELVRAHLYGLIPAPHRLLMHDKVADHLLERLNGHQQWPAKLGLEVAWHLFRSHRKVEAAEYLLLGCHRALLEGAPDEVVLSIRSCLGEIGSSVRSSADLLLARAYNELGQWADGLDVISRSESGHSNPLFRILSIEARWHLGLLSSFDEEACIRELIALGTTHQPRVVRAFSLAAFMAGRQRSDDRMHQVLSALPPIEGLAMAERAELLTAVAHLAFYARRLDEGEAAANLAKEALDQMGAADLAAANIEIGLGVFRIARSDYSGAASHFANASRIARRIDNDSIRMTAETNAALSWFRVGDWESAIMHAREVRPSAGALLLTIASYVKCASLALAGRHEAALGELSKAPQAPCQDWLRQNWLLQQADVYWLCGKRANALATASTALGVGDRPLARGTTGLFVRWAAKLVAVGRFPAESLGERLQSALDSWENLDRLDQYEVLSVATDSSRNAAAPPADILRERLAVSRAKLPPATIAMLDRLDTGLHTLVRRRATGSDGLQET